MQEKPNIVLIGMPGSGKSTIGRALAEQCNLAFVDGDVVIESTHGKRLEEIIAERGIEGFLQVEAQALMSIQTSPAVISTGGSAIYSEKAMAALGEKGHIVYLSLTADTLKPRLGDLVKRGVVLKEGIGSDVDLLLAERLPLYERYAEITLTMDGKTEEESIQLALECLGDLLPQAGRS